MANQLSIHCYDNLPLPVILKCGSVLLYLLTHISLLTSQIQPSFTQVAVFRIFRDLVFAIFPIIHANNFLGGRGEGGS